MSANLIQMKNENENTTLKITQKALPLSFYIDESIFIKVIRSRGVINTLLKAYILASNNLEVLNEKQELIIDSGIITFQDTYNAVRVESYEYANFCSLNKEKFVFTLSNHFLEQILKRNLVSFDWSVLSNIYREVLSSNDKDSCKKEMTNGRSSIVYSVNNGNICLITAWIGNRKKA